MAKPNTTLELIQQSTSNYLNLLEFIAALSIDDKNKTFHRNYLNRNIRDVVAHLHHWHLLFIGWHDDYISGRKPTMPAKGYTWKTLPALNKAINKKYKSISLNKAISLFKESHKQIHAIIESYSEAELWTKRYFSWTGSTSVGAYLISSACSHYVWALKLIKKNIKP